MDFDGLAPFDAHMTARVGFGRHEQKSGTTDIYVPSSSASFAPLFAKVRALRHQVNLAQCN